MVHYFITGASSGIGKALAQQLCADEQLVSAVARRTDRLQAMETEMSGFHGFQADVTSEASLSSAIADSIAAAGPINVAILNAGIYEPQDATKIDPQVYARHMDVNYMGVVNALASLVPHMISNGGGKIVIVSSVAGWRGLPKSAAYGPTKAALISLAESLVFDLAPKNIAVQVVCPGFVESEATAVNDFEMPGLMTSDAAANDIITGMSTSTFLIHFPKSFTRKLALLKWVPDSWFFKIVARQTAQTKDKL